MNKVILQKLSSLNASQEVKVDLGMQEDAKTLVAEMKKLGQENDIVLKEASKITSEINQLAVRIKALKDSKKKQDDKYSSLMLSVNGLEDRVQTKANELGIKVIDISYIKELESSYQLIDNAMDISNITMPVQAITNAWS